MGRCRRCGRCCWDWKGGNPENKCEYLGEDLVTCSIYDTGKRACDGLASDWPQPAHAVDLPPECGYVVYWRQIGLI
jgi:hypothetical protein